MRNLKRALSLTLASVMLLGMMVVGSSAAAGYDDVSKTDNVEAIEVLQAVEVMVGDERGFGPERPVNRAEMAVVMGKLLNLDYNYYASSCPFNDVYDWARGWVGACYANKIVSGRGESVYDPGSTVTAVEAASMLMRALGYFQYANDVADGFELSTVRQGTKIGIFDGVGSSATAPMTRNQVAQMVLNALQADTVEPDGNTINLTTPDGTVLTGKVNYVSVTRDEPFATAISKTQATSVGSQNTGWIVELGERLYNGDLKLYEYTDDDFMRPARTWEYDGKTIGTYMKKENIRAEYTDGVNRRELYDLLGRSSLNDYDFKYYVDGVEDPDITVENILTRTTKDYGTTGRGVLTQVFVDTEAETIDITSINTWLAKATADYNATRESAVLNVYNNYVSQKTSTIAKTVSLVDVPEVENVKKDQYLLVNWSGKDRPVNTYEVVEIADVEILSDSTLTKFSKRDSDNEPNSDQKGNENIFASVTTDGTEYKNSKKAYYSDEALDLYNNNLLTNKTYNVYLDKYGYAIGVDLYSGDDNYVFISGVKLNDSTIAMTQADANAIFTDGTTATIKVNVKDTNKNIDAVRGGDLVGKDYFKKWNEAPYSGSDLNKATVNRWFTYTVDKDNVYTLSPAARMITSDLNKAETIKCDSVVLDMTDKDSANTAPHPADGTSTRIYGNDDSVYIIPELDNVSGDGVGNKVIAGVDGRYTGVQSVEIDVGYHAAGVKLAVGSDNTELYDSVYAVYDKNNYVIAAVIVGEAKGTSANYAYILTAAKDEEKRDDTYYWTFDAVVDGAKQTLTLRSKFANTINSLLPGHVQELRYTDEYVTAIKDINTDKFYTDYTKSIDRTTHEVYEIGHMANYTDPNTAKKGMCDTTKANCVHDGYTYPTSARLDVTTAPNLHTDGRTLYLGAQQDKGLTFVEGAPAVVIQFEDGSRETRYFTSVDSALAVLADADGDYTDGNLGFAGRLTAILNSQGVAKWIVIESDTPQTSAYTGGIIKPSDPNKYPNVIKNTGNGHLEVRYYKTVPTNAEIQSLISKAAGENCTYNPLAGTASFGSGLLGTTYTVDLIEVFKVTSTERDGKSTIQYLDDGHTGVVPGLTAGVLYAINKNVVVNGGSGYASSVMNLNAADALGAGLSADIALKATSVITLDGSLATGISVDGTAIGGSATLFYVTPGTKITVTGTATDGKSYSLQTTIGGTDAVVPGTQKVASGTANTYNYTVPKSTAAITLKEVAGAINVKLPDGTTVSAQDGDTLQFTSANKHFYVVGKTGANLRKDIINASASDGKVNNLYGNEWLYTVDDGDVVNGRIEIRGGALVTLIPNGKLKIGAETTKVEQTTCATVVVETGTTVVAEGAPGTTGGENVSVNLNGGGAGTTGLTDTAASGAESAGGAADGTPAVATYQIPTTAETVVFAEA